jgi:glycosyltransferase involved in cell wall biosynthesis
MGHRPRSGSHIERDWKTPQYLYVGVDWERKNGEAVLAAFRRVRQISPTAVLHLVGDVPAVDEPGVVRHGYLAREDRRAQARLDELYARATCFVLPSRFDPSAIAYLEACSAGLPVIASTVGGSPDLLGDAALLVEPNDNDSIAQAMARLSLPDEARRLGMRAARVASAYSWRAVARRLLAALQEAREGTPGSPCRAAASRVPAGDQKGAA